MLSSGYARPSAADRLDLDVLDRDALPHEHGLADQVRAVVPAECFLLLAGDDERQVRLPRLLQRREAGVPVRGHVVGTGAERLECHLA